ncbi:MAG: DUF11 domain-containing protein, partial [Acidobacteria bacterium]|nr:DUF11 domain-containing protein [Acidobacteriota bacterium]
MMGRTEPTLTATALRDPRRWTSGPGSWSFRKGATWLPRLLLLVFGAFAAAGPASAHHFHYVNITDSRYSPDILFDLFGEDPLERWIVFTGNDQFSFIDDTFDIYGVSQPQGTVQAIFDFPFFENVANPRTTVYIELRINLLDTSGQQTIELGFTDLANEIKWDEAARRVTATQDPGNRVLNTPRLGPNFPLSVHLYYHMADWVAKAVATDTDGTNQTTLFDWTGTQQPFRNFFPFPGTDPDNLDIYSFVKCEAECEVQMIAWGTLTCDTVDGAIDLESCDSTDLAIAQDDGRTTAVPGRSLTYTIEATNRGLFDVVGATVTDAFPPA